MPSHQSIGFHPLPNKPFDYGLFGRASPKEYNSLHCYMTNGREFSRRNVLRFKDLRHEGTFRKALSPVRQQARAPRRSQHSQLRAVQD